ncbi:MAG: 4Fe-4S dicluster domain-containing protein [Sutterella sp.]|nr:4Fe-4S dicluster domain-containing protein [Sutterella sp.]
MSQKTLVIDLDRCIGCYACEVACKQENHVPLGMQYNKVFTIGPMGKFPEVKSYFLPAVCQVCKNAPCVTVCPTGASYRTEDGQILINKEKCIGCKLCMKACPYGARSFNEQTKVVEKCTLCNHLQAIGEQPACVKVCCARARFFGDIDDPQSDVSKAIAAAGPENVHTLPDTGNHPTVRYILHAKTAPWQGNPPKMG